MNSSISLAQVCVELPFIECVQFRGVPTPYTSTMTFFILGVCSGADTSLVSHCAPPNLSAILPSHLGKSVASKGKKTALICNAS